MAKFLDTKGIAYHIDEIIKNAKSRLWLVSPYLQIDDRTKQLLKEKDGRAIKELVMCARNEPKPDEKAWLESLSFLEVKLNKDLHAKCYLNEEVALLTSMNLYQYSMVNNREMGVLVNRREDPDLYKDILEECKRVIGATSDIPTPHTGKRANRTAITQSADRGAAKPAEPAPTVPASGFCIRCKTGVKVAAPEPTPYCRNCYRSWNRSKDPEYKEKYCHLCGNENSTSFSKPLCLACYRKYKDVFEFAS